MSHILPKRNNNCNYNLLCKHLALYTLPKVWSYKWATVWMTNELPKHIAIAMVALHLPRVLWGFFSVSSLLSAKCGREKVVQVASRELFVWCARIFYYVRLKLVFLKAPTRGEEVGIYIVYIAVAKVQVIIGHAKRIRKTYPWCSRNGLVCRVFTGSVIIYTLNLEHHMV